MELFCTLYRFFLICACKEKALGILKLLIVSCYQWWASGNKHWEGIMNKLPEQKIIQILSKLQLSTVEFNTLVQLSGYHIQVTITFTYLGELWLCAWLTVCYPEFLLPASPCGFAAVALAGFLQRRRSGASVYDMSHAKVRRGPHVAPEIAKHAAAELDCSRALCRQSAGA